VSLRALVRVLSGGLLLDILDAWSEEVGVEVGCDALDVPRLRWSDCSQQANTLANPF
jgi:hypothetical protein